MKTGVLSQDSVVQMSKTTLDPNHVGAAINHLQNLTDILSEDYRYPFVWYEYLVRQFSSVVVFHFVAVNFVVGMRGGVGGSALAAVALK